MARMPTFLPCSDEALVAWLRDELDSLRAALDARAPATAPTASALISSFWLFFDATESEASNDVVGGRQHLVCRAVFLCVNTKNQNNENGTSNATGTQSEQKRSAG